MGFEISPAIAWIIVIVVFLLIVWATGGGCLVPLAILLLVIWAIQHIEIGQLLVIFMVLFGLGACMAAM
jgi:hypothetical protein